MQVREIELTLTVTVPATVSAEAARDAINERLNEGKGWDGNPFEGWFVGGAMVERQREREADEEEQDYIR
jgi:hypothetical protein